MTIYDKTDTERWSDEVQNWEANFDHNDVVISRDPQERLGQDTILVSRIRFNDVDCDNVQHLGVFWRRVEARRYAEAFNDDAESARQAVKDAEGGL